MSQQINITVITVSFVSGLCFFCRGWAPLHFFSKYFFLWIYLYLDVFSVRHAGRRGKPWGAIVDKGGGDNVPAWHKYFETFFLLPFTCLYISLFSDIPVSLLCFSLLDIFTCPFLFLEFSFLVLTGWYLTIYAHICECKFFSGHLFQPLKFLWHWHKINVPMQQ